MLLEGQSDIELALARVGALLEAEETTFSIVILGGAALNLLGIVERTTRDVDILAFADPLRPDRSTISEPPNPLPQELQRAIASVARDMGLESDWLNTESALQWRQELPREMATRIQWRRFGGLTVGITSRYDLVFFKLYAAADWGIGSVHYQDLLALNPTTHEIKAAAAWVRTQDVSAPFHAILDQVLNHVARDLGHSGR